jgi:hypothetical protein
VLQPGEETRGRLNAKGIAHRSSNISVHRVSTNQDPLNCVVEPRIPRRLAQEKTYALLHLFGPQTLTLTNSSALIVGLRDFYGDSPMLPYHLLVTLFFSLVPRLTRPWKAK